MTYNDIKEIAIPIRWGAILLTDELEIIERLLGDDMVSKKQKESFIERIKDVNSDDRILEDWMFEENARLSYEGELETAKIEGLSEGIEKGIEKGKQEGLKEGKRKNLEEVIRNMLSSNFNYETISKITGKSIKDIELIAKQI